MMKGVRWPAWGWARLWAQLLAALLPRVSAPVLAGIIAATVPLVFAATPAQAQSCSMNGMNVNASYSGTALSQVLTQTISCTGLVDSTTYTLCFPAAGRGGSGGNAISPYRKLDDGSGNKANWQLYDNAGNPMVSSPTILGTASGYRLNAGSASFGFELRFPQQSVGPATYSTSISNFSVNLRTASDCSGNDVAQPTFVLNYAVTVPPSCSAVTGSTMDFGNLSSTAFAVPATGRISITCTPNTAYTVYVNSGSNPSDGNNRMRNGSAYLSYVLYTDSARTSRWTSAQGAAGSGSGSVQTLTIYGLIPAQTTPPVGIYSDTVIVTLHY